MRIFVSLLLIPCLAFGGRHFSPKGPTAIWDSSTVAGILNGTGTWDINNSLFNYDTLGIRNSPFCQGCNVSFGGASGGAPGVVTVNGIQKINSFTFNTVPSGNFTLTGGEISCVNFSPCTYTANYSGTIGSVISGTKDLIKQGPQTLTLSGVNTYTGNTNVNAGTLEATTNVEAIPGNLIIAAGATGHLNVTGDKTFPNTISGSGTLKVTAGGTVATVTTLSGNLSGLIGLFDIYPSSGGGGKINLTNTTQANTPPIGSTIRLNNGATIYLGRTLNYESNFSLYGGTTGEALGQLRVENGTVTGPVTLFANSTIGTNGPTGFISGVISGGGFGFTKEGSGNITLTNNNTYTGTTIISAGTLQLGDGIKTNNIIPATNLITDNAALVYNTPSNISHSGVISGSGTFNKQGTGTLSFTAVNTYTGTTAVNAGTLQISNGTTGTLGNNSNTSVASGATLIFNQSSPTIYTYAGNLTGSGTVLKNNTSTEVRLSGDNSAFAGVVNTTDGILRVVNSNSGSALASWNFSNGAGLALNVANTSYSFGSISGDGSIFAGGGVNGTTLIEGALNTDTTFSGPIDPAGTTMSLTKMGTGIWTLTGITTYTGVTNVNAGNLKLTNTSTSPTFTIASGAVLELNASGADRDGGSSQTFNGLGTLRKTGANSIFWGANAGTFALGSGAMIDIQGGQITGGNSRNENWTSNLSDLNVANGAILSGVEGNIRVDAMTGAGNITSGHADPVYQNFTFGVDDGGGTFDGVLGNTSAPGNFVKAGNGTQILTGVNTYTGSTTVSAGTLQISGSGSLNSGTYAGAISNSGTFKYSSSATQTLSGGITGTGILIKDTSTSILTLTGAGTFSGTTNVNNGTLKLRGAAVTVLAGSIINNSTLEIGNTLAGWGNKKDIAASAISGPGDVIFNSNANTNTGNANAQLDGGTVNLTGAYTDTGPISITGNLAIESGGVNTSGDVTISNVSVLCNRNRNPIFGGLNGLGFVALCAGGSGTFTIGNGNKDGDFSGQIKANQNGIDGTLGGGLINITKIGTGRQKISVSSCFTGTTTVSAGILELVNADICGTINDNATLNYNNSSAITHSGAISGTGSIIKDGVGVLSVTGNNTSFTGSVTVNAGTFSCDYPAGLGSGTTTVRSGATLTLGDNNVSQTWTNPIVFAGPDTGTNALLLSPSMNFQFWDSQITGAITLNTPTTFQNTRAARSVTYQGPISGPSSLTSVGGFTHTFSGNNTYTGGTIIRSGQVVSTHDDALGSGTITLGDASTGGSGIQWSFPGGGGNNGPPNNVVTGPGTGGVTIGSNSGGFTTLTGTMTWNRAVTLNDSTNDRTTINGKISGNVGTITITGKRITFGNSANDFVGNIVVSDGSIYQSDHSGALPNTTGITLNGTGIYQINNGGTHAIKWLSSSSTTSTIQIPTAIPATLSIGGNTSAEFNGAIANGSAVLSLVVRAGTAVNDLYGNSTFTGGTTVNGYLRINKVNGLGTGPVTVNTGGTLDCWWVDIPNTITLNGGNLVACPNP